MPAIYRWNFCAECFQSFCQVCHKMAKKLRKIHFFGAINFWILPIWRKIVKVDITVSVGKPGPAFQPVHWSNKFGNVFIVVFLTELEVILESSFYNFTLIFLLTHTFERRFFKCKDSQIWITMSVFELWPVFHSYFYGANKNVTVFFFKML